jgi:DDE family transposase
MSQAQAGMLRLSRSKAEQLLRILMSLPDSRHRRGRRHDQTSILAVAICAVLCGASSYVAIAEWARRCSQNFLKRLGCRKDPSRKSYTAPSEPTIRRVLQSIDAEQVDRALAGWLRSVSGGKSGGAVAIDGKTLRGARRQGGGQVHLLSAMLHGTGVILGQCEVEEKSNEIPAAPQLLDRLELSGMTVTADALHTQRELAEFLVNKGADYVFTVKDNQPTLKRDVAELFGSGAFPP